MSRDAAQYESLGQLVGRQPTPRALIITEDDDFARAVAQLFGHHRRVKYVTQVRQEEYDIVVSTEPFSRPGFNGDIDEFAAPHMFVVSFGVNVLGVARFKTEVESNGSVKFESTTLAQEYLIPGDLPSVFVPLVRSDLLPAIQRRVGRHLCFGPNQLEQSIKDMVGYPLLMTADRYYLAALYARSSEAWGLALPGDVSSRTEWVEAALKYFRGKAPQRFERIPGWEEDPLWHTAQELAVIRELEKLAAERIQVSTEWAQREEALRGELAKASAEADAGFRQLLTSQGDDLARIVAKAFECLGFDATLMDANADPNNRLEDIRVNEPGEASWEALVEVRGYRGGAALSDLPRVERFVRRYRDETGRWPDAVWYVVNQFAGQDPATRPKVLASQQAELDEWVEGNNGLAIDTAVLFRLITNVDAGLITKEAARAVLRDSRGRYEIEA